MKIKSYNEVNKILMPWNVFSIEPVEISTWDTFSTVNVYRTNTHFDTSSMLSSRKCRSNVTFLFRITADKKLLFLLLVFFALFKYSFTSFLRVNVINIWFCWSYVNIISPWDRHRKNTFCSQLSICNVLCGKRVSKVN